MSNPPEAPPVGPVRVAIGWLIKLVVLPFRFVWLLGVWLRLRRRAMKASE